MKIHFIGIGGIGISALAQFCHARGDTVYGSEIAETGILEKLRAQGIPIFIPQKAENIPQDCELVVYTEAVSTDNPERVEAKERGIQEKSYFQYLGDISRDFRTIAVCGTHGKTTTVGLLASAFQISGFDATVFVGSKLREFDNSNFHLGTNDFLLVEACEYRNNFQFLHPEIVLLTNAELDHTDFYRDADHYRSTFRDFCKKAKVVIYHEGDADAEVILTDFSGKKIVVSSEEMQNIASLQISGAHNRANATLAFNLAQHLGLDLDQFKKGLESYKGAWRRQEFLGEKEGVRVFDDYGHHPTEIRATLQAFRERFPDRRIGLIFEPHQYSRTREFFPEFCDALSLADEVGIFPIYAARDTDEDKKSVSVQDLIDHISGAEKIETQEDAQSFVKKLEGRDVLLFMGAGVIDQFAKDFLD